MPLSASMKKLLVYTVLLYFSSHKGLFTCFSGQELTVTSSYFRSSVISVPSVWTSIWLFPISSRVSQISFSATSKKH